MKISGILLDLDGVITETSELHYRAWKELAAEIGIEIDGAFNEQLKGISRMQSLERILCFGGKEGYFSDGEKRALAEHKNARYVELLKSISPGDVLPGIRVFLADAREAGIRLALASASRNAPHILGALGLAAAFDYVADAGKVARSKPHPDIFLAAAAGIAQPPASCVGIEDAAAGIEAIHAAGMRAVGIGSAEHLDAADLLLPDTSALGLGKVLGWAKGIP